jgi:dihydrofolate reductase
MAILICSAIVSLDGYVADAEGRSGRDIAIGAPTLAPHAFREALVGDLHLFISPMLVGGGTPALPSRFRSSLELRDRRTFGNGVVHLHYRMGAG